MRAKRGRLVPCGCSMAHCYKEVAIPVEIAEELRQAGDRQLLLVEGCFTRRPRGMKLARWGGGWRIYERPGRALTRDERIAAGRQRFNSPTLVSAISCHEAMRLRTRGGHTVLVGRLA